MKDEHGNLERLVVGHVLGDLADPDASRFRTHLRDCVDCRARVAELRGIAADLAAAEQDELARVRVRTEMATDLPRRDDGSPLQSRITVRHVTVAAILVVVLAAAMAFWNLHLRNASALYFAAAEERGEALDGLATGTALSVLSSADVRGIASTSGGEVTVSLSGVEPAAPGELVVAWFLDGPDGTTPIAVAGPGQLADGVLVATLEDPGAEQLLITREQDPGDEPAGAEIARVRLPGD